MPIVCLRSSFLARNLLAFLSRLRQPDGDRLLAALHPAASAAASAFCGAALVAAHLAFDIPAGAAAIAALSFLLGHGAHRSIETGTKLRPFAAAPSCTRRPTRQRDPTRAHQEQVRRRRVPMR